MIDESHDAAHSFNAPTTMPEKRTISPRELRIAAEAANGLRDDEALTLVYRDKPSPLTGDRRRGVVVRKGPLQADDVDLGIAIEADAEDKKDAMTEPVGVFIDYGKGLVDLKGYDVDAVFWSESAIDKFVLPYYVSLLNVQDFEALRAIKRDPFVMALMHYHPTVYVPNAGKEALAANARGSTDVMLGVLRLRADGLSDAPSLISFEDYLNEKRSMLG
jgi:hypothetical protein